MNWDCRRRAWAGIFLLKRLRIPLLILSGPDRSRDVVRTAFPSNSTEKHAGFSPSDDPYLPLAEPHKGLAVDIPEGKPQLNAGLHAASSPLAQGTTSLDKRQNKKSVRRSVIPWLSFAKAMSRSFFALTIWARRNFPSDRRMFFNNEELRKLGLTNNEILFMKPYDSQFAGRASPRCSMTISILTRLNRRWPDFSRAGFPIF